MKSIRNIFSVTILLAVALAFTGCQGEEPDLFEKSAAERLNEIAKDYTAVLAESEAGWIMEYYPTNSNEDPTGLGYLMLVDFDKNGSVKIGMMNDLTEGAYEEATSLWEIITDNGPVLSFSTYNEILHFFSDPAIYDQGLGLEGDYEFVMVNVPEDHQTIMLKGKKRGTYVRLTRLPAGTDFQEYLADVRAFQQTMFAATAPNYDYMHFDGKEYELADMSTTLPNIYLKGSDAIANEYHVPFIISKIDGAYHLRFRKNVFATEDEDKAIQEFVYNESEDIFYGVNESSYTLEGPSPSGFFADYLSASSKHAYLLGSVDGMSEEINSSFDAAVSGLAKLKWSLEDTNVKSGDRKVFEFFFEDDNVKLVANLRNGGKKTALAFLYEKQIDDSGLTLTYKEPADDASATVLDRVSDLNVFLNLLSGKYELSGNETKFNLEKILFKKADGNYFVARSYAF